MKTGFYISTDKSKLDINSIHAYLSNTSYWAKGRSREIIEKSINNSLSFGVFNAEHDQVGFARVITDFAVFAWILDVFIVEDYQSQGLGKKLLNTIMTHEELQGLKRWGLATRDAHGLYEKFGFRPLAKPENMMEFVR